MLSKERIKEAEKNVEGYLDEEILKKTGSVDNNILNTFRKNSEESLRTADFLFKNNLSWLWVVVCSYYSMYYIANAVLYKLGYKVGHAIAHKTTADALIVFVRGKLKEKLLDDFETAKNEALDLAGVKADELILSFDFERMKRSKFQYVMTETIKSSRAETSLKRAKEFVFEMEKLLV